ncbi:hypothetical protein KFE25_001049 [Diacronema lutheri]|uniref:peptidylprolyl isomerase n=1 Tax=Diacronema lutheri TaxID=2081491 RepID=A0A8J5XEN7_DIALT|nr:hypothetical protein KFE25_001049 [Diacronema lutheri]
MGAVTNGEVVQISPGLTKKVTRAGNGQRAPSGSTVNVHYTGKLADGKVFDSSRTRGQPFSFELEQGNVIAGWDRGVATMTVGEQAVLTIAPELGYGSRAVGPIPPNSTLTFEVELVSWSAVNALRALAKRALFVALVLAYAYFRFRSATNENTGNPLF